MKPALGAFASDAGVNLVRVPLTWCCLAAPSETRIEVDDVDQPRNLAKSVTVE
jgi:hypothetical protein